MSFLFDLGKSIMPENFRLSIRSYLLKTGRSEVPFSLYAKLFILSILMTIASYFLLLFPHIKTANVIFLVIASFIALSIVELILVVLVILALWIYYEFVIFQRTRNIEEVLPDFLEEVSVNLRAGMSFDNALWNSIRPEFDVLEKEIEIVAKRVMAGEDTEHALKEFSEKYNSTLLQESMDMIVIGLKSGGNIADLIDKIVSNVKEASFLNRELIASVTSYVIFIVVIAVVISPILFALSFNLMEIIQSLGAKLSASGTQGAASLNIGERKLNPEHFIIFSKISVLIISGIASIIIADLREGSIKAGLKYIFLFAPISFIIYVVMLKIFTLIFGIMT
ncbi:MAG: type II secretion system F family protein [archaeon]